ncbi:heat stress transcription factor A-5-like [Musa acuminata AAA Group]|uniref:heat stress transcription factor A-5-like n=1 Tax=Musa acuminata AAA Group TaxID=214697 RepID=UPI0031CE0542
MDGGGGGGPARFLLKTYDMVDDASTDDIVSWSSTNASFVVWNPPDFAARLLPTYFKHNNFSSFIRQLNTYGFRKIDSERWEFANEDFVKGQKRLLANIRRRKPIHSHSHPPGGGLADSERAVLEEEIDRLNKEKAGLKDSLLKFEQQQSGTEIQIEDLKRRLADMEQRQLKMVAFVQRALQNPQLMENLVKMAAASSVDFSYIHKKRRLPLDVDYCQETSENSFCDDHSSTTKPENGRMLDLDFCDKLKLELCSAIPDDNLVMVGTQSSNEDNGRSQPKQTGCGQEPMECPPLVHETLQLCDTEAPACPTKIDLFIGEIDDGLFPCHLSLTLASSTMQIDSSKCPGKNQDLVDRSPVSIKDLRPAHATDLKASNTEKDDDLTLPVGNDRSTIGDSADAKAVSSWEASPTCNEAPAIPTGGVNDVFWQQFLTERPGSSDTKEASSCLRPNPCNEQGEETMEGSRNGGISKKDMEQLKL